MNTVTIRIVSTEGKVEDKYVTNPVGDNVFYDALGTEDVIRIELSKRLWMYAAEHQTDLEYNKIATLLAKDVPVYGTAVIVAKEYVN